MVSLHVPKLFDVGGGLDILTIGRMKHVVKKYIYFGRLLRRGDQHRIICMFLSEANSRTLGYSPFLLDAGSE